MTINTAPDRETPSTTLGDAIRVEQGAAPLSSPEAGPRMGETDSGAQLPRTGLLDRDWQKALIVLLTVLAFLAVVWVGLQILRPILRTVLLFVFSGVLAFALAAPVNSLGVRLGNRVAAIVLVYGVLVTVIVSFFALISGPLVSQIGAFADDFPRYARELEMRLPELEAVLHRYGIDVNVGEVRGEALARVQAQGSERLGEVAGIFAEIMGILVDVLLALVISFYFLLDGPSIRRRTLALIPEQHRSKALFFEENATRVLGGYLRGQLILAVTIGIAAGVGTAVIGLPYAILLGVLAGVFELVPMFGPILSAVPPLLVSLFMPFPTPLVVLGYFFVVQQVENNILVPRISGHAVGLHPLGALFALLAGFQFAGVLGALFAVPTAGILWVLVGAAYRNAVTPPRRRFTLPRFGRPRRSPASSSTEARPAA